MADKATVLVVDDEPQTRELERRVLETGPYTVLEASRAKQAFEILAANKTVDLLVSDLEMPGLSGEEMVRRIRALFPKQKVLYVSGMADRLLDLQEKHGECEAFLDKPFTAEELLEAVSRLLYGTPSPPLP